MSRTNSTTRSSRTIVTGDQCRCGCGALLARVVREGLEVKCHRCKNPILIEHEKLVEMCKALELDNVPSIKPPFRRV